jgi:hypothetical protein
VHYLWHLPKKRQPLVVLFTPRWLSGDEDLARRRFREMLVAIARWVARPAAFAKRFSHLAEFVTAATSQTAAAGKVAAKVLRDVKTISELKGAVLEALRDEVCRRKSGARLCVGPRSVILSAVFGLLAVLFGLLLRRGGCRSAG